MKSEKLSYITAIYCYFGSYKYTSIQMVIQLRPQRPHDLIYLIMNMQDKDKILCVYYSHTGCLKNSLFYWALLQVILLFSIYSSTLMCTLLQAGHLSILLQAVHCWTLLQVVHLCTLLQTVHCWTLLQVVHLCTLLQAEQCTLYAYMYYYYRWREDVGLLSRIGLDRGERPILIQSSINQTYNFHLSLRNKTPYYYGNECSWYGMVWWCIASKIYILCCIMNVCKCIWFIWRGVIHTYIHISSITVMARRGGRAKYLLFIKEWNFVTPLNPLTKGRFALWG